LNQVCKESNLIVSSQDSVRTHAPSSSALPNLREEIPKDVESTRVDEKAAAPSYILPPVVRQVNGSLVISTRPIEEILRNTNGSYVVPDDTIHAVVKGMIVIGVCVLIPWCVLLVCCVYKMCTCAFSQSSSNAIDYGKYQHLHPGSGLASQSILNQNHSSGINTAPLHNSSRRRQVHISGSC